MAYYLHETSDDPFEFVFYEIWRSEIDYQAHLRRALISGPFSPAKATSWRNRSLSSVADHESRMISG
jgi:quinol monooxygenase YgiN